MWTDEVIRQERDIWAGGPRVKIGYIPRETQIRIFGDAKADSPRNTPPTGQRMDSGRCSTAD